jgi:hypothetical protein
MIRRDRRRGGGGVYEDEYDTILKIIFLQLKKKQKHSLMKDIHFV